MNVTMQELIDPRGQSRFSATGLSRRLESLDGKTIGLLNNGKPDFDRFLLKFAQLLKDKYPSVHIVERTKPEVPRPVPGTMLAELAENCDAVVTGLGD